MKFRYYITDLMDGSIKGTDNEEVAGHYACSEDHFVVDTETGEWLLSSGERIEVEAA